MKPLGRDFVPRCPILENILQRKLNQPRIYRLGRNLPKGSFGHIRYSRVAELWVIVRVEEFGPELEHGTFSNTSDLGRLGQ